MPFNIASYALLTHLVAMRPGSSPAISSTPSATLTSIRTISIRPASNCPGRCGPLPRLEIKTDKRDLFAIEYETSRSTATIASGDQGRGRGYDGRRLVLVAAVAENGVIGAAGGMPWHLSSDLKRFRAITTGHPVLMGRKTYASIGRPLPGRDTIVVTRGRRLRGGRRDHRAVALRRVSVAEEKAAERGVAAIMVIGGGEIFSALIGQAAALRITEVHARARGRRRLPRDRSRAVAGDGAKRPGARRARQRVVLVRGYVRREPLAGSDAER